MEIYRIPADPQAFTVARQGVLHPPPEVLAPRGGDREAALTALTAEAGHEYLQYLVLLRAGQVEAPAP